jgi:hypothetical protein
MSSRTIHDWVMLVNTEMSKLYELKKSIPIIIDDYGYASYKSVLTALLNMIPNNDIKDIEEFIKKNKQECVFAMHDAWCQTYIEYKNNFYTKATNDSKKGIHTHERNERATNHVENIPISDKEVYEDIINIVVSTMVIDIITISMNNI